MRLLSGKCRLFAALLMTLGVCLLAVPARVQAKQGRDSKEVTVTLDPDRGTVSTQSVTLDKNGTFGRLPKPKRDGYRFRGWYTQKKDGIKIRKSTPVRDVETTTLYAHWKTCKYKITYDYDGGTLREGEKNPSSYTVRKTWKLAAPRKEGYRFLGWYTSKDKDTGVKIRKIRKKTMTGDLTLYALYEPITYTIRFKKNGVLKKSVKKLKVSYGEEVTLPKTAEQAFASWNTSPDGSGKQYSGGAKVKNLTAKNGSVIILYANPFIVGNNIDKLYDYFQRIGFTKAASAAIVGNLMYESGGGYSDVKLNAVEWSTGRGIGMCQWTNTADMNRRTNFERYCASRGKPWPNQDLKVQVDFLMLEMEGKVYGKVWYFLSSQGYPASYEMSLEKFKKLTSVSTAVAVFCANFERPRPEHANLTQRTAYARYVMNRAGD